MAPVLIDVFSSPQSGAIDVFRETQCGAVDTFRETQCGVIDVLSGPSIMSFAEVSAFLKLKSNYFDF